jgi:hypothetical protein
MKYGILAILILIAGINIAFGAEEAAKPAQPAQPAAAMEPQQEPEEIKLPVKDTPEYWNVRSEAMGELLPFLTKKRADIKKHQKVLVDYLTKLGKAEEFASLNIPIAYDPAIYAEIAQVGQGLKEMNIPAPKTRPTWEDIMDIAMKHVLFEGYLPTQMEEGDELTEFINMCKKKEEYGQKVRKDLRTSLDQCARIWVYLIKINKKDEFKAYYLDMKLEQQAQKTSEQQALLAERQAEKRDRVAEEEQARFDNKMERADFRSSRKERAYESRQAEQLYRQSRLDERYTNSRAYYY